MIDIIVLTYNQEEHTIKCIESIRENTEDYRLVWVDNGSTLQSRNEVTPYFLQHTNRLAVWSQVNLGFVRGINLGLRTVFKKGPTNSNDVVLQNNDTIVTPGWLDSMRNVLNKDEKIMAVGPVSSVENSVHCWKRLCKHIGFPYDSNFEQWSIEERSSYLKANFNGSFCEALDNLKPPLVKMIAFFSSLIRKSIFHQIGLLDEGFKVGLCDDRDFCKRIYDAGYECSIALDSYVHHDHATTFKAEFKNFEINELHEENLQRFTEKHQIKD